MVDCDVLTDFNKEILLSRDCVLLDYKNCDYALRLSFPYSECVRVAKTDLLQYKKLPIKAVYGIIKAEINSYLVVITKASLIGQIYHRKIYEVQKIQFICLAESVAKQDKGYLLGLEEQFQAKTLYFSNEYDLTNSLQQFIQSNSSPKNKRLEYMYNSDWIDDFVKVKAYEWVTGFISGFISISFVQVGLNSCCELALVTRRNKKRQGRRWLTRGADLDGNCANTAQTETIFLSQTGGKEALFSHVQLRGSIPFAWKQTPDFKWSPTVKIHPNDKLNADMMKKHYELIKEQYPNCLLVNLIDKKGTQLRVGEYFEKTHRVVGVAEFKLIWFDFHAQCKNMKYENLSQLLDLTEKTIQNYGYFHSQIASKGERASKKSIQTGILRTNCMDCLDRTNVVQSVFARQLLLNWLCKCNIIPSKPRGLSAFHRLPDELEEVFRAQWTRNADTVSCLYSGTPAMKTDFTATGKRTNKGAIMDGYYGVKRYFLGTFYDSREQDYIDFSLNKIKPSVNKYERVRHSFCNSLFFLIILIVLFAVILSHQLDPYVKDMHFLIPVKTIIALFAVLLTFAFARQLQPILLRQPIREELHF